MNTVARRYARVRLNVLNPFLTLTAGLLLASSAWAAPQYKVLHGFSGGTDGGGVWASVIFDKKGNLYGTTSGGGDFGQGTVFKLKPQPSGDWTKKILHSFDFHKEGAEPTGGLVFDPAGNLYGTAPFGGENGTGSVFELTPGPNGWTEKVIYSFGADSGAGMPYAGLVQDKAGNLYGTASNVFELTPTPNGWIESLLYTFCSKPDCSDGYRPYAGLVLDAKGNLYGTTEYGGIYLPQCPLGCGVVYKLRPMPDGSWKERVLHSFGAFPNDGKVPRVGALAFDSEENLYGTTQQGGRNDCGNANCGTIFRLSRQPNGHWKETILYHFKPGKTGNGPGAGVVVDSAGNLYGTTIYGGTQCDCGVVYKLAPNPDGSWTYTVLHRFTGYDGAQPDANLILDDQGNLYGTTATGGPGGGGVVFKVTP